MNNNTHEVYDQTHYRVAVEFFPLQSHRYACKSFWGMQGSNFPVAAFYDTIIESLLTIYVYIISSGSVGGCAVKPILVFMLVQVCCQ